MRASPADIAVRFYNGDGLTVIEQSLQRACQLWRWWCVSWGKLWIKRVICCCRMAFSWGRRKSVVP